MYSILPKNGGNMKNVHIFKNGRINENVMEKAGRKEQDTENRARS